jgi:hypothetical protein
LNLVVVSTERPVLIDPCNPSPCGPYATCQKRGSAAACTCLPRYVGSPPNCRPECVTHTECPSDKACFNEQCGDPCEGACGENADCYAFDHRPVCQCKAAYEGDPFRQCELGQTCMYNVKQYIMKRVYTRTISCTILRSIPCTGCCAIKFEIFFRKTSCFRTFGRFQLLSARDDPAIVHKILYKIVHLNFFLIFPGIFMFPNLWNVAISALIVSHEALGLPKIF